MSYRYRPGLQLPDKVTVRQEQGIPRLSEPGVLAMKIEGTVVYVPEEGGFWGIEATDGAKYRPVDEIPESLRENGRQVVAEIEPANVASFTMWGQNVRLLSILPQ